jgi:hypothetical protein
VGSGLLASANASLSLNSVCHRHVADQELDGSALRVGAPIDELAASGASSGERARSAASISYPVLHLMGLCGGAPGCAAPRTWGRGSLTIGGPSRGDERRDRGPGGIVGREIAAAPAGERGGQQRGREALRKESLNSRHSAKRLSPCLPTEGSALPDTLALIERSPRRLSRPPPGSPPRLGFAHAGRCAIRPRQARSIVARRGSCQTRGAAEHRPRTSGHCSLEGEREEAQSRSCGPRVERVARVQSPWDAHGMSPFGSNLPSALIRR